MIFARTLILLLASAILSFGADEEGTLYQAAAAAFHDKFYDRAEQQFGEFAAKFPNSTNLASAILAQAQARQFQKKHDAAVELLRANAAKAGALAPQYLFAEAEALGEKGDRAAAAEAYGRLLKDFADSPLRLAAAYLQAWNAYQHKDAARAIELLQNPEGAFQKAAKAEPASEFAAKGSLLLGSALLGAGQLEPARAAAPTAGTVANRPDLDWERHDLLARIELAGPKPEAALAHVTNAVASAVAAQKPVLEAQSWNIEAEVYRKLNQPSNAVAAYEKIAGAEGLPIDQRRLAMLKSVELLSSAGNLTNAIVRLESYLSANTNEPSADLLRVKAGELWIDRFRALAAGGWAGADQAAATNSLQRARGHLNLVANQMTNSPHAGRAWLNLGWTFWEEGAALNQPARMQESEAAFRTAAERLTRSDDQALALFKLADAQYFLKRPEAAVTNYLAVIQEYADVPQVRNALFDKTYRQLVRASIELKDLAAAARHAADLRQAFPNSPLAEESLFLYGRALARAGRPSESRAVFEDFLRNYPASALAAEVRFAEAGAHAAEGGLEPAMLKLEQWLGAYTNHALRGAVEFQRAALAGQEGHGGRATNALALFTNFVSQFPAHPLAPAAQNWVADYYYEREQWAPAEQNYQRLFQNTNWVADPLAFHGRMMAARTAFLRQGYDDARAYLTNLIADPKCPPALLPEAWFALGDVFLKEPIRGNTNALHNFAEAAKVFDFISREFPSNRLAVLALAKKGDCHFQLAAQANPAQSQQSYAEATNAYGIVLSAPLASVPVAARNQAEAGLALALEKMAEGHPPAEREALLQRALAHLLNVVYGANLDGGKPDPYYLRLAGREGGRIAEALGQTEAALQLYRRLANEAPHLKAVWDARISALQARLDANSAVN